MRLLLKSGSPMLRGIIKNHPGFPAIRASVLGLRMGWPLAAPCSLAYSRAAPQAVNAARHVLKVRVHMLIVSSYAALLALVYVALSVRTLRLRRRLRIPVGDGGDPAMLRAMRVHANFAEYVPLSLMLVFFVEAGGAPSPLVHGLALSLLAGRCAHAYGVSQTTENFRWRVAGMVMTFAALLIAAAYLLWRQVSNLVLLA